MKVLLNNCNVFVIVLFIGKFFVNFNLNIYLLLLIRVLGEVDICVWCCKINKYM